MGKTIFLETFTHGVQEEYIILLSGSYWGTENKKLVTNSIYSKFPRDENFKDFKLQTKDFVYWKGQQIKDSLQPWWKKPYQVLLTNPCAAKLKDINSWIHISHFKKSPPPEWTLASVCNTCLQLTKTSITKLGPEDDNNSRQLTQESEPEL